MGFLTDFLQGYAHTKRQEYKARAKRQLMPSSFWDNQEDPLENVLPVSFSFGRIDVEPNDATAPLPSTVYPISGENEEYGSPYRGNSPLNALNENFPGGLHGSSSALFYDENSSQDARNSESESLSDAVRSPDENGEGKSASSSHVGLKETSMSGPLDKEGEWMYQLNALAKEHAQRNKSVKAAKNTKSPQNDGVKERSL